MNTTMFHMFQQRKQKKQKETKEKLTATQKKKQKKIEETEKDFQHIETNDDDNVDMNILHLRYNGTILKNLRPYELLYGRTKKSNLGWKLNAEFITEKTTDNTYEYRWDAGFLQTCCKRKGEWVQLGPGNVADDEHLCLSPLHKILVHRWTPPLPK
eukprot:1379846-Ditylum_brightwellii.AAC.1